jgi:predicted DNA-binding transcriptional regulator AlpA
MAAPRLTTSALDPFIRKSDIMRASGMRNTKFHQALNDGSFPPPDAHLSGRMPVWRTSTFAKWQEEIAARPQPTPDLPMLRSRKAG